jgi:hypothetical protein
MIRHRRSQSEAPRVSQASPLDNKTTKGDTNDMAEERKILYSPFGAGWSTWNNGNKEVAAYMLTYQPIIEALEKGEKLHNTHPLVLQLQQECAEKFNTTHIWVLSADRLKVATVKGRVRLFEYDGSESFEEEDSFTDWM